MVVIIDDINTHSCTREETLWTRQPHANGWQTDNVYYHYHNDAPPAEGYISCRQLQYGECCQLGACQYDLEESWLKDISFGNGEWIAPSSIYCILQGDGWMCMNHPNSRQKWRQVLNHCDIEILGQLCSVRAQSSNIVTKVATANAPVPDETPRSIQEVLGKGGARAMEIDWTDGDQNMVSRFHQI